VRTAAAAFHEGAYAARHLFDALCSIYALDLRDDGSIHYRQRLLDSELRRRLRAGLDDTPHFFTGMKRDLWTRLRSPIPRSNDNTNVNVLPVFDTLVALTETNIQHEIDPETLHTRGPIQYDDEHGHKLFMLAHPRLDRARNTLVNLASRLSNKPSLMVYEQALTGPRTRRVIAQLPVRQLPYVHSFGLTPQHVVVFAGPLLLDAWRLLYSERGFIHHFRYHADRGSKIYVVDRATGSMRMHRAPAMFVFHVINTFERADGALVQDVLAYHDASIIESLAVAALRGRWPEFGGTALRLVLHEGREHAEVTPLADQRFDFPTVHDAQADGRPYRYTFGAYGRHELDGYVGGIVQLDVEQGHTQRFSESGYVFLEPLFVPAPQARHERDGVLLSMACHTSQAKSALAVLDAESLAVRAWGDLDIDVPLSFHGSFLRA
jgi:beta,beta-carotene 9',10'-dioxygenase